MFFCHGKTNGVTIPSVLRVVIHVWQISYAIELYCVTKLIFLLCPETK
jgi:hypothetical protein